MVGLVRFGPVFKASLWPRRCVLLSHGLWHRLSASKSIKGSIQRCLLLGPCRGKTPDRRTQSPFNFCFGRYESFLHSFESRMYGEVHGRKGNRRMRAEAIRALMRSATPVIRITGRRTDIAALSPHCQRGRPRQ